MEETQRQNIVMAFNNVLRTSTLLTHIDLQRTSLAFSALLDSAADGDPIPLTPLYDFFLAHKAPEPRVREVIAFLKSRESRFAVTFDLPPPMAHLTVEELAAVVAGFTQRGATTGTFAGKSIDQNASRSAPGPLGPGRTATPAGGVSSARGEKAENPAGPRGQGKGKEPQTKKLLTVLGLLAVGLVVSVVVDQVTAPPPPKPLIFNDPAGLPCTPPVLGSNGHVLCKLPKAFLDANPEASLRARAAITTASAKAQGYAKVMVFQIEDGRLKWVF